jgi:hypothetical protein
MSPSILVQEIYLQTPLLFELGACSADELNNTLRNTNTYPPSEGSMLPKNKTAVQVIALFAVVQGI